MALRTWGWLGAFILTLAVTTGCGSGGGGGGDARLEGSVVDAVVQGGQVNVIRLNENGSAAEMLGSTRTDAKGRYRFPVLPSNGFYRLLVQSGTFTDEASGREIDLAERGIRLRATAAGPGTVHVTPITTLHAALVDRALAEGRSLSDAVETARQMISDLFAVGEVRFDPHTTDPAGSSAASGSSLGAESLYASVLEGISRLAYERDQQADPAGAGAITSLELMEAMAQDLADGALDGFDGSKSPPQRVMIAETGVELVQAGHSLMADLGAAIQTSKPQGLASADLDAITDAYDQRETALDDAAPEITAIETDYDQSAPVRAHARGGDLLTITGSGFTETTSVWIGEQAATVQSVSPTALVVLVPVDTAGLKDLVVVDGLKSVAMRDAVKLVGDAASLAAFSAASTAVQVGASNVAFSAAQIVDALGEPVLDGDLFDITLSFAPAAGAGEAQAPTAAASVAVSSGAIAFEVTPGERAGVLTVEIAAREGSASAQADLSIEPGPLAALTLVASEAAGGANADNQSQPQYELQGTAKDAYGNAVADGTAVAFTIDTAAVGASFSPSVALCSEGAFSAQLLGVQKSGTFTVRAQDDDTSDGTAPEATASVGIAPGAAASLTLDLGGSSYEVASSVAISGSVVDQFGNVVADGTAVTLAQSDGEGGFAPAAPTTTAGLYEATWTAGTVAGAISVQAQAGSAVTSSAVTLEPGPLAALTLVASEAAGGANADNQSQAQYELQGAARDAYGNAVADGTAVAFAIDAAATGASFSPAVALCADGAFSTELLGVQKSGSFTVRAQDDDTSDGAAPDATAQVTIAPGAPAALTLDLGGSSYEVASIVAISGSVVDQFGNMVADGTAVTLAQSDGQGGFTPAAPTTTAGLYEATWSAGTVAGAISVQAQAGSAVTSSAVTLEPGPPAPGFSLSVADLLPRLNAGSGCVLSVTSTSQIVDQYGNVVANSESFTATVPTGLLLSQAPSVTDGWLQLEVQADPAAPTTGSLDVVVSSDSNASATASATITSERAWLDPARETASGYTAPVVIVGDLAGDGTLSVVELTTDAADMPEIAVSAYSAATGFAAAVVTASASGLYANSAALADFDGDGDLDLFVADKTASGEAASIDIYRFDAANPTYFEPAASLGSSHTVAYRDVALADVDGDGDLDVAACADVWLEWYPQDVTASAVFGGPIVVSAFDAIRRFALADFDGDGALEALVLTDGSLEYADDAVLRSGGATTVLDNLSIGASGDLAVGDVDGDGLIDAVIAHGSAAAAEVSVRHNLGAAAFEGPSAAEVLSAPFLVARYDAVRLADMNGDGQLDIVVLLTDEQSGRWLFAVSLYDTAAGVFGAFETDHRAQVAAELGRLPSFAVSDLDGDAALDLIAPLEGLCVPNVRGVDFSGTGATLIRGQ